MLTHFVSREIYARAVKSVSLIQDFEHFNDDSDKEEVEAEDDGDDSASVDFPFEAEEPVATQQTLKSPPSESSHQKPSASASHSSPTTPKCLTFAPQVSSKMNNPCTFSRIFLSQDCFILSHVLSCSICQPQFTSTAWKSDVT